MISEILGGASLATGLAGSIFGASKAAKAARQMKRQIKSSRAGNQAWYDRRYNEDALARSDARALIDATTRAMEERARAAAGRQAVAGGTASRRHRARSAYLWRDRVSVRTDTLVVERADTVRVSEASAAVETSAPW